MQIESPPIKQIDFFREEKNNRFYEVMYEQRKLKRQYVYERGSEAYDDIIVIKIGDKNHIGIGECSPFPSFFEWPVEKVLSDLKSMTSLILSNEHFSLIDPSISSPARSGIDLALIDLKCNQMGKSVYDIYNLGTPHAVIISHTVEYESLTNLQSRLQDMASLPLLKVKLGSDGLDENRLRLVRQFSPNAKIIVDVNEGWTFDYLKEIMPILLKYHVCMIEQPLKHGQDLALSEYKSPIPIYADESFKEISDLAALSTCYSGFNIKLDKIGGLTNALQAIRQCKQMGKNVMVGCLGGTSLLSTAGLVTAQLASYVDLDNHLWLCQDHEPSLGGEDGIIKPPPIKRALWGSGVANGAIYC